MSPRQLFHSIVLLFHVTKRYFLVPIVYDGWATAGFSNFWLVRPALVVCCLFLYRVTSPPLFVAYFLRSVSERSVYFVSRTFWMAALGVLCAEYSLTLMHQAPMAVKCGGLWSVTFACRCLGTISREEGWEVWVLLLPPGYRTWGASFWSCCWSYCWCLFSQCFSRVLARLRAFCIYVYHCRCESVGTGMCNRTFLTMEVTKSCFWPLHA